MTLERTKKSNDLALMASAETPLKSVNHYLIPYLFSFIEKQCFKAKIPAQIN